LEYVPCSSFKQAPFGRLRQEYANDPAKFAETAWEATQLLDQLGLFTVESYTKTRESVISRQQQELLELSTQVVELWTGILALPLIGTLDSSRTQVVMQNLLEAIVARRPISPLSTSPASLPSILWLPSIC